MVLTMWTMRSLMDRLGTHQAPTQAPKRLPRRVRRAKVRSRAGSSQRTRSDDGWGCIVIEGADQRVRVVDTRRYPYRCVCALRINAADGTRWLATGCLIGERTVITAGHCVFHPDSGGWASAITVIPGANGQADLPFGSSTSGDFRTTRGWYAARDPLCDYGAIILPCDGAIGAQLGYFGYTALPAGTLAAERISVTGYPADKLFLTQWTCASSGIPLTVADRTIGYDVDTTGGDSGAPLWVAQSGKACVLGVHTTGEAVENTAIRVTPAVFANFDLWRSATH
jgi:glutamyl endopeptidase